ncbi:hypothetical protein ACTL6P_00860 [Endozoicomonas acroporae]|uniref:hypothetical protein n=1 Tax=Endozoicomonas acroporae TaxID=1701104 RepID=UPI001C610F11|nr:hypothetical protein [Endozoicomonas acroporae]
MPDIQWTAPGATLSHKNAAKEFGLTEEAIIRAIKEGTIHMPKVKKKLTAEQKRIRKATRAERRKKYQWIFINGKRVRIKREDTLEAFAEREAMLCSADPIWLHQNELWEYIQTDDDCLDIEPSESDLAIWEWDGDDEKVPF